MGDVDRFCLYGNDMGSIVLDGYEMAFELYLFSSFGVWLAMRVVDHGGDSEC